MLKSKNFFLNGEKYYIKKKNNTFTTNKLF